ncbi:MAG TPA: exosortase K [Kofleriaceae bacterium]|nr:exosortase K [Kofleriaceae bacterium]
MRARIDRHRGVALAIAAAVIIAGKVAYRHASADELRWILAPTARLVGWVTGARFVYEPGAGYVDHGLGFVIAPVCAGLHFALAGFLALTLGWLPAMTSARAVATRLAGAAALALAATPIVNGARIALAVLLRRGTISAGDVDPATLHEDLGVAVYLGGLCLLCALVRTVEARRARARAAAGGGDVLVG